MAAPGPDRPLAPDRCLAVLLGASSWNPDAGYQPAPEFAASAAGLREYIAGEGGLGVASDRFLDLFDSRDGAEAQLRALRRFLRDSVAAAKSAGRPVTDIFVCAVSHGTGTRQNPRDLHLVVHETEGAFIDGTGLPVRQIAAALALGARSLRRYIVLDCCFSGAALANFQSGAAGIATLVAADIRRTAAETADPDEALSEVHSGARGPAPARGLPASGTVLLCSSRADDLSLAKARDGRTLFTGSILRALAGADGDAASLISFAKLRDRAWGLMLDEVGEAAPYPQLFAPNQTPGDLSALPLLPLRAPGKAAPKRADPVQERPASAPVVEPPTVPADADGSTAKQTEGSKPPPVQPPAPRRVRKRLRWAGLAAAGLVWIAILLSAPGRRQDDPSTVAQAGGPAAVVAGGTGSQQQTVPPRLASASKQPAAAGPSAADMQDELDKLVSSLGGGGAAEAPNTSPSRDLEGAARQAMNGAPGGIKASQAGQATRAALKTSPKDPDLWNKLGSELEMSGDLDGAIDAFQKSVALPPKDIGRAYLLRDLADALEERNDPQRGDLDAALAAAQRSIRSWPVSKEPLWCSAEVKTLVSIMVRKGDRAGAEQLMQPIFARVNAQDGFGSAFCGEIKQLLASR